MVTGTASGRKTLLTHVRQQVSGPVGVVLDCAEALLDDARRGGFESLYGDLDRIHAAASRLLEMVNGLADQARLAGGDSDEEFAQFCSRLRHDLRTPINAVKGYAEMVLEDAEAEGADALLPDLRRVLAGAASLLEVIDLIVRPLDGGDVPLAEAGRLMREAVQAVGPTRAADAVPALKGRILVVDDNDENRTVLSRRLQRDGHQVVTTGDGRSALALLKDEAFDLVLLDMMMPGMSGYEVLTAIKWTPAMAGTAVIMISALDEIAGIVRCIEVGAEDYLSKPFNPVLLRARIDAALEKKRLRDMERLFRTNIERELGIARQIQTSIMPKDFPPMPKVSGHGLMVPAREVGGDFYDFIPLDDHRIGIAVGDVSGKGVPAAFFMAIVRTLLRSTALFGLSPGKCLERLNALLLAENDQEMFVTLFYGILDSRTGDFVYANGGHNLPMVIRAAGTVEPLKGTDGLLVGVMDGFDYGEECLRLSPGDAVFIFTDGVVEAFDPAGALYGEVRLVDELRGRAEAETETADLTQAVLASVKAFECGGDQADDITCVAVRWNPGGVSRPVPGAA